jgi:excisionase family DNA binding protein
VSTPSLEQLIADAVERGTKAGLESLAALVAAPQPLVYKVAEAAHVLGLGEQTIRDMVNDGRLPRLPHTDRVLIPRRAVEGLVESAMASRPVRAA